MIVTGIEEFAKGRYEIYLDGQFAFVLYKGELRSYQIEKDKKLSDSAYYEITGTILPKRAKLRAMNLLQSKDYTEQQLRDKLRKGKYPEEILEEAIEYVKSFRYLDDDRYTMDYLRAYMERRSFQRMKLDLLRKGISGERILRCWEQLSEEDSTYDEGRLIRQLLEKKHFNPDTADSKEKQRIFAFLYRKGFSPELIRKHMLLDITSNSV